MKQQLLYPLATLLLATTLTSCDKSSEIEPAKPETESAFARLLITDKSSTTVTLLNPAKNEQTSFQTGFGGSAVYPAGSGRFAAVVNSTNSLVEFFDTGIEAHDDHVHIKGTPKWALTRSTAPRPSHVVASHNRFSIFNDGDASISYVQEGELHTRAVPTNVVTGAAHHGAMLLFNNGNYVVTHKDNTVSGTLPERVKIVNAQGVVVAPSTVATKGMHGDATDGKLALFGAPDGVLAITSTGEQRLIPYPTGSGDNWLSTIYYAEGARTFLGSRAGYGLFRINTTTNTMTRVGTATALVRVSLDAAGKDIAVLEENGQLTVFDAATGAEKASRSLTSLIPDAKAAGPYLAASNRYVYVTNAPQGKVHMLDKATLTEKQTFTVAGEPLRLAFVGADSDSEDGGH
ncbi:YncE family protein [Hymenobacter sp. HD11105]